MGRIVSNFFISLDGVVESPEKWHFQTPIHQLRLVRHEAFTTGVVSLSYVPAV